MPQVILALDQGTTGSTAAFFDADTFALLSTSKVEFPQIYPKPGEVEHDPDQIWNSLLTAIHLSWSALTKQIANIKKSDILCIGITNQRETVVPWNKKSGELAGNAIVWQDRRTSAFCDELKRDETKRSSILNKTGLVCDPYFSGSKMRWILKNYSKAQAFAKSGDLVLGTIDSFIIYKLTGGSSCLTDDTNASRTMLYDLKTGRYDKDLCALFGVSQSMLPEINPSAGSFGVTKGVPGLLDGIPITGCLGDQQSALFGHDCLSSGEGKITYGTGAFLLVNTGETPTITDEGLLSTVAWSANGKRSFALEGSAFIAGAAVQFLRDNFQWFKNASESEAIALADPRDENVLFVPALAGLGAPFWNPNAKAVLFGLTRGTKKSQIVRAVLESIALQNVQILTIMENVSKIKVKKLGVDGGAARSDMLMQFQSDMCRVKLLRPRDIETTAKGAAKAALHGLDSGRATRSSEELTEFSPKMDEQVSSNIVEKWISAARCVDSFYK